MPYIDFDNENDVENLKLTYKNDTVVLLILEEVQANQKTNKLMRSIRSWAEDKNLILGATNESQFQKLMEETIELYQAIRTDNLEEFVDAVGDCAVVLTVLAAQRDLTMEHCIEHAYHQIKDRKGKMINGVFVKNV